MPDSLSDITHLRTLFSAIDEGFCLCEMIHDASGQALDYRFLAANALFGDMTGLPDPVGHTARELVPGLEDHWVETYARVAAGGPQRFQSRSERMGRLFDVFATPVAPAGRFVLVFRDITARRQAEDDLARALNRTETLLRELNHRVMNTLSMMAALVRMERQGMGQDDAAVGMVDRLQGRLSATAELYRALGDMASGDAVRVRPYLERVAATLSNALADAGRIQVRCEVVEMDLPAAQATALGLLVNELMTNALKYAFPNDRAGRIEVRFGPEPADPATLALVVADDGVGLPDAATGPQGTGLGGMLVQSFVDQLDGAATVDSGPNGTVVTMRMARPPSSPAP